ncbi:MAG: D-alanyl-D-alanine carboxypeptidase [Salaquimonas sp.]
MRTFTGSTKRLAARVISFTASTLLLVSLSSSPSMAKQDYAGIVMDAKTGKVLYSHDANEKRYPASLTKMMTLYMVFDAMEQGKLSKKTRIKFSSHAASMQPSKLGVKAGSSISAEQAILALVTKSANDAAAAVGEHLGGSESKFAEMMTAKARSIGMKNTTFRNASGLPDSRQVTTAKDMAILGIALREHFPQHYSYFSTRSFKFGKKNFGNHNRLLGKVRGVDGIKTGYTRASGFNLVSSVDDRGRSIVGVVLGGKTGKSRNAQMAKLINDYLPKASKGRDRIVVAKGGKTSVFASIFKRPSKPAIPEKRPEVSPVDNIVTASVAPAPQTAIPAPTPSVAVEAQGSNDVDVNSGWHVQIGAMPSRENAIERLENARKQLPTVLASTVNYTETVDKNGTKLYRARFAGFITKDAAWGACSELKKKKIDCLALSQN